MQECMVLSNNHIEIKPFNKKIKLFDSGFYSVVILTVDNELYFCGQNFANLSGALRSDSTPGNFIKIDNSNMGIIKLFKCGLTFTIIVNNKNEIFVSGELCQTISYSTFTKIETNIKEEIISIKCGFDSTYIITKNNLIYRIDNSVFLYNYTTPPSFKIVNNIVNVKDIQCGNWHTIYLNKKGSVYMMGNNCYGQLGIEELTDATEFTKINFNFKVIKIACYDYGTLILNEFNEVFGCGKNNVGQLGFKSDIEYIKEFTKIQIDFNIKNIFTFFFDFNILISSNNEIYFTGNYSDIYLNNSKPLTKYKEFKTDKQFIYPLINRNGILVIACDYNIVNDFTEDSMFHLQLWHKSKNENFSDISLHFPKNHDKIKQNNEELLLKKRKLF